MKKNFAILAFLIPLAVIASEVVTLDGFTEPEWSDFAPQAFVDVSEPRGIGKLNETATYWYNRRVEFETNREQCRAADDIDVKISCYQELKVKQYQNNSDYNARIEAQERARLGPQEMYDKTDNMLPIGGYLNTFTRFQPNELRGY